MDIYMIGIDHSMAPVDIRAKYAFTKKNAGEAMLRIKEIPGVYGCIILSTCNRLEVWVSMDENSGIDLYTELCRVKDITECTDAASFVRRQGRHAAEHLFYLTSGLKSQVFGEDQILTQVKDALSLARENFASDGVLEVLFRMAVTAGKKIKTEVSLSHGNPSVIHKAIEYFQDRGTDFAGKTCMVIGNGEMGKVAAQALRAAGADVTVTVRQYKSGIVDIPAGCKRINYGERMAYLPCCEIVVSATASPNFTLREELFANLVLPRRLILIDLAVPRDIEPSLGTHPDIDLYDMDSFKSDISEEQEKNLASAGLIVAAQLDEFFQWMEGRDMIPVIHRFIDAAVHDLDLRMAKPLKSAVPGAEEQEKVEQLVNASAAKVINKLIFGLRDQMSPEMFTAVVHSLDKIYEA